MRVVQRHGRLWGKNGKRRGSVAKPPREQHTYAGAQGKGTGVSFSMEGVVELPANTFRDDLPPFPLVDLAVRLFPTLSKEQMESTHNRRIAHDESSTPLQTKKKKLKRYGRDCKNTVRQDVGRWKKWAAKSSNKRPMRSSR